MRRILALLAALLLVGSLVFGVSATSASKVQSVASVASDGTCQVTLTATLDIDKAVGELVFPVPEDAYNITVNGNRVRTQKLGQLQLIDLSGNIGGMTGVFSVTINYAVGGVVVITEDNIMLLQLPLLSGFAYSVENLEFAVTLPGPIDVLPAFSSGYHQASIEKDLSYSVDGATVTGFSLKSLKDHETLTMTMVVTEQMFPHIRAEVKSSEVDDIAMAVCAVLALIYWFAFMRTVPAKRQSCSEPPEVCSAGELGTVLNLQGADLTVMVLSWAQLGYVFLEQDRRDRVLIYKRMDMGNERSSFEQKCFRDLFRRRDIVDTSGLYYAQLCRRLAKAAPLLQHLVSRKSGSSRIFRAICALVGGFGGMSLGIALSGGAVLQWLWIILLVVMGTVCSWHIQSWGGTMYLWNKQKLHIALAVSGVWLLLGLLAEELQVGLMMVAWQWLAGFLAAFGGRRTGFGKQLKAKTLGLRSYMRHVSRAELQRISTANPEYYFDLAPYALALNVDQSFARHFGKNRMPECPYLVTPREGGMSADQWCMVIRQVATAMDRRSRQLPMERFAIKALKRR